MAKYESLRGLFTAIADAIRAKTGSTGAIVAEDFPEFIEGIEPVIEPLTISENGTYTAPDGIDGYSPVTVEVKGSGGNGGGIATGVIIPTEDITTDIDITHNLGEIPKLAVVYRELTGDGWGNEPIVAGEVVFSIAVNNEKKAVGYYYKTTTSIALSCAQQGYPIKMGDFFASTSDLTGSCVHQCTETTAKLFPIKNGTKKFAAGSKYRWILFTEEAYNAL